VVAVAEAVRVRTEVVLPLAGGVTGLVENAAVRQWQSGDAECGAALKLFWLATVMVLVHSRLVDGEG